MILRLQTCKNAGRCFLGASKPCKNVCRFFGVLSLQNAGLWKCRFWRPGPPNPVKMQNLGGWSQKTLEKAWFLVVWASKMLKIRFWWFEPPKCCKPCANAVFFVVVRARKPWKSRVFGCLSLPTVGCHLKCSFLSFFVVGALKPHKKAYVLVLVPAFEPCKHEVLVQHGSP